MSQSTVKILGLSPDRARLAQCSHLLPPWPEWHDVDLSEERWDSSSSRLQAFNKNNKPAPNAVKPAPVQATSPTGAEGFENPLGHCPLPPSLPATNWKRASNLHATYEVFTKDVPLDLLTSNHHLMHSAAIRHIVSCVANLQHFAMMTPFKSEMETSAFVATVAQVWRPWHHVYALCTAGKGEHKPQVNPFGKYVVRLFFMGAWRRITVDDYLPVDEYDRLLLPTTPGNHELWPLLLTKALLTVASLTWRPDAEVVDFNAVACLTGWMALSVECGHVSPKYLWSICQKLLMTQAVDESARYAAEPVAADVEDHKACAMRAMLGATSGAEEDLGTVAVCGELDDVTDTVEELDDVGPCVGHHVLMSEARVIRIGDEGPLPKWKLFRWKAWALRNGIIQSDHLLNLRSVRLYSPLKKFVLPPPEAVVVVVNEEVAPEPEETGKGDGIKTKAPLKPKTDKAGSKSSKSKLTASKKGPKVVKPPTPPIDNMDTWMDLNVFAKYLSKIHFFLRPSCFQHCHKVGDLFRGAASSLTDKVSVKRSPIRFSRDSLPLTASSGWPAFKAHRPKEHVYLLIDSLTCKKVFFTLTVVPQQVVEEQERRVLNSSPQSSDAEVNVVAHSVVCQEYHWRSFALDSKTVLTLTTTGTATKLLQIEEGLHVFRIWAAVGPNHSLEIRSQTPFLIGSSDEIFQTLANRSYSLNYYGADLFKRFTGLKDAALTSPLHPKLLSDFHAAYLPKNLSAHFPNVKLLHKFIAELHDKFEEAATMILLDKSKDNYPLLDSALKELQRHFVSPNFGLQCLQNVSPEWCDYLKGIELQAVNTTRVSSKNSHLSKTKSSSANLSKDKSKVKTVDKKTPSSTKTKTPVKEKKPKKTEDLKGPKHVDKKSKHILFDSEVESGIAIILKMIELDPNLLTYYPFRNDLDMRLFYADYKGTSPVTPNQEWFPIVRFTVNLGQPTDAFNSVELETSAPSFLLRIVNNDTMQEIPNTVAGSSKHNYVKNDLGYTILACGYNDLKSKTLQHSWKLRFISDAQENLLRDVTALNSPPKLALSPVYGHYIPNRRDSILRCLLSIRRSQIVSLRFVMSNPLAEFRVKILYDNDSEPFYATSCRGQRVIPSLPLLIGEEDETPMVLLVEAELVGAGWQLTEHEQNLVHVIKEKHQQTLMVFSGAAVGQLEDPDKEASLPAVHMSLKRKGTVVSAKDSTSSFRDILNGAAFWGVQAVIDADKLVDTVLEANTRKEQEIRQLKAKWEREDPGRYRRALEARRNFLEARVALPQVPIETIFGSRHWSLSSLRLSESFPVEGERREWEDWTLEYKREQAERRRDAVQAYRVTEMELLAAAADACVERRHTELKMEEHYDAVREVAAAMMAAGYEPRDEYVRMRLEAAEAEKKAEVKEKVKEPPKVGKNQKKPPSSKKFKK